MAVSVLQARGLTTVKDACAFARETLGRPVGRGILTLDQVMRECSQWVLVNQVIMVALVVSHDPRRPQSPHLVTLQRNGASAANSRRPGTSRLHPVAIYCELYVLMLTAGPLE